jgi:hypothetical protein
MTAAYWAAYALILSAILSVAVVAMRESLVRFLEVSRG